MYAYAKCKRYIFLAQRGVYNVSAKKKKKKGCIQCSAIDILPISTSS